MNWYCNKHLLQYDGAEKSDGIDSRDLSGTQEKSTRQKINYHELKHPSKVPQRPHKPTIDGQSTPTRIPVDAQTLRLSLVDLDNAEAHRTLEDAIEFASQILSVDTDGVEPLYTVLERERLTLREDRVSDGNIQQDVLRNARVTEEEYFVAPPGNITLEQEPKK
ncbi:glutamyl-tRNA(Gln) amidotransferase subunit C-2, mitochondrial-like [Culex quinquefasciatus]|uniref:glutamyl-tRNA(Gln) amidotransferase subunit C-2, mitochondrial-like n=1 Tax=Culex quinquefasciatus TaxID=7176 RepID=UPI0018E345F9|nr:glutamyl-tRNA(Gln) amidotransferase subunit C-2, mitochondrial-like [Culex quinquefasciatus]